MKKNIMKQWVKALRSEEYFQVKHTLCRTTSKGDSFCCLGVLCDLYARSNEGKDTGWVLPKHNFGIKGDLTFESSSGRLRESSVLPFEVIKWAGMQSVSGRFITSPKDYIESSLASLNDDGKKFKTIAKIIEGHWKTL